jgi:hypothetical protein|tara:strand:+ start:142 stop:630 length:489 start_codon:yes stop_codon:yes gene_type:complete
MNSVAKRIDTTYLNNAVESYPSVLTKQEYRDYVTNIQEEIISREDSVEGEEANAVNPVKHTYADGLYIREIFMPRGEIVISKIHKIAHPFFLIKGKISVLSEDGEKLLQAPYYTVTPAGTKRMLYTHTNAIVVTVHRTFETDLNKIEDEIIAKSFDELEVKI